MMIRYAVVCTLALLVGGGDAPNPEQPEPAGSEALAADGGITPTLATAGPEAIARELRGGAAVGATPSLTEGVEVRDVTVPGRVLGSAKKEGTVLRVAAIGLQGAPGFDRALPAPATHGTVLELRLVEGIDLRYRDVLREVLPFQ